MRYFLGLLALTACSGDPGTTTMSAEPVPVAAETAPPVLPAPPAPTATAPDEPPLQEAPEEPTPAAGPPAGFHEAPGGACYLPDVLKAGDCKCEVIGVSPGNMCFDSCKYNADGVPEFHAFCVDGGLAADRRL